MTDRSAGRGRAGVRPAQLLLVVAAGALWAASRLPWVVIRSADGLGSPRRAVVAGADWSTALVPLALLTLAAAVAAVAVHGWALRVLAVLLAAASLAGGYLGVGMWAGADVIGRGAAIADVSTANLVGGEPRYAGPVLTVAAALCMVAGATLLLRAASAAGGTGKYLSTAVRQSRQRRDDVDSTQMSERMIWDALDDGRDPTDSRPDGEGR